MSFSPAAAYRRLWTSCRSCGGPVLVPIRLECGHVRIVPDAIRGVTRIHLDVRGSDVPAVDFDVGSRIPMSRLKWRIRAWRRWLSVREVMSC
jgi:hypothetical protein